MSPSFAWRQVCRQALRLSRYFGNSPEFWLNAQRELDLWEAERLHKAELKQIKPATAA
jgi:plasmid maintenance system antidote protein VapI